MAGFLNTKEVVDSIIEGRTIFSSFRKIPSQATSTNWWADLSMAAGNPQPNYYASSPLAAAVLDGSKGIFHGFNQSPSSKHLFNFSLATPNSTMVPSQLKMLDYLLYYPFIDADSLDLQEMDNTVTLPRYSGDAEGTQIMAVAVSPSTGGGSFVMTYENEVGQERTTSSILCATASAGITSIVTSQPAVASMPPGPFIPLNSGDKGITKLKSVQFSIPNGGLLAFVIVKPISEIGLFEINTVNEVEFLRNRQGLPRVYDGAYLNLIMNTPGSIASNTLSGSATFIWSE